MPLNELVDNGMSHYRRVLYLVRKLSPRWLDHEDLSVQIWIECWEKNILPTKLMVNRRIIDKIRYEKRRAHINLLDRGSNDDNISLLSNSNFLDKLMKKAGLTRAEENVIFLKFYLDMSTHDIADKTSQSSPNVGLLLYSGLEKLRISAFSGDTT